MKRLPFFTEHQYDCFDEEAMELIKKGINPISFPGLKISVTSDDSKAINYDEEPKCNYFCQRYV